MQHLTANPAVALEATGPFLHAPAHKAHLSFDSLGDVPRSFSVVIAQGALATDDRAAPNGLAVIDNDSGRVVCDGIQPQAITVHGPSMAQQMAFTLIQEMDFRALANYCRSRPTYRGGFDDIDGDRTLPNGGSRERQIELGLLRPSFSDIRPAVLKEINAISAMPYRFPVSSRQAMINETLARPTYRAADGSQALAWDIRMNFKWNATGHVEGGESVERSMDRRWAPLAEKDGAAFKQACDQALQPYVAAPFVPLDLDPSRAADLDVKGDNGGFLVMSSFAGKQMTFSGPRELEAKLDAMSNDDLSMLWAAGRILDKDLSKRVRATEMALAMNEIRAEMEVEWLEEIDEPEAEVAFDF